MQENALFSTQLARILNSWHNKFQFCWYGFMIYYFVGKSVETLQYHFWIVEEIQLCYKFSSQTLMTNSQSKQLVLQWHGTLTQRNCAKTTYEMDGSVSDGNPLKVEGDI